MAVNLQQGTLNPLSTQKIKDLMDGYITGMTAAIAAGKTTWSIVDNGYVNGTSNRVVFVNSNGFAIMLVRSTTLTDTILNFYFGQSYNSTTKNIENVAFLANTSRLADASGFSGVSYNPTATSTASNTPVGHGSQHNFQSSTSQSAWSLHVEDDWLTFSFNRGTDFQAMWFGKFISLVSNTALTDTYPFGMVYFKTGVGTSGLLHSLNNASITLGHFGRVFSFVNAATPALPGSYDKYSINPAKANMNYIYIARNTTTPPTDSVDRGWLRGYLPGVYFGYQDSAAYGDTISIDGKSYMLVSSGPDNFVTSNGMPVWVEI